MGVRVLYDFDAKTSVIYDSVTETVFGILMHADREEVYEWLNTLPKDARLMSHADLEASWSSRMADAE